MISESAAATALFFSLYPTHFPNRTMEQQPTRPYFSRTMHHRWRKPVTFSIITLVLAVFFSTLNATLTPQQLAESEGLSALVFSTSLLVFLFITESAIKLAMLHPKIRRHTNILGICIILLVFLIRDFSIHYRIPSLPYETPFFSHFYPSIFGTSVSLGELVLNVSILLYFTLYVIRYINVQRFKNKGFNQAMAIVCFSIVTCLAFAVFFTICAFIGNMVLNTEFIIVPDKIAFFNADSYYIIFVIFSSYYCFALLIHKIIRLLSHAARHSFAKSAGFLSVNFLVVAIVSLCCWHTIYGIPTWVILILLGIYLVSGALTYRFARKNFRFFSILVKVIFAAFFISTILYIAVRQKESDQRQRIVAGFVAARAESESAPILDRNFINEASQLAQKYSFGYYSRGELIDQCGKYDYKLSAEEYLSRKFEDGTPIKSRGYIHHVYPISKDEILIMGEPDRASFNYIASLAFFFITFLLFYLFCVTCIHVFARPPRYKQSLYSKLLWISLTALLLVGVVSCVLSLLLYNRHSDNDQKDILHAKAHSAQLSFLRHGGRWEDFYQESDRDSLQKVLEEFEKTYELHIDVYDLAGNLLNSSDSNTLKKSIFIETPVKEHFSKSYAFLYKKDKTEQHIIHFLWQLIVDSNGNPCIYLKTYYVKDRHAWKMELSDIVMSFMHVFGFLIFLAVLATWAIYFLVASSLSTIGKAMQKRRGKNSPLRIHWVESEEIGQLIQEHNLLINEIHQQGELLAKSERETAWRDMALEIAHEIKNPLTPMKLKMQMLQHVWHSGREDFPRKMEETSEQILKQIDALTEVADTFTEFASTQQSVNKDENLYEVLDELRDSLASTPATTYRLHYDGTKYCHAFVDRKLFLQMARYLIKNADHNRNADGRLVVDITFGEDSENSKNWLFTFASNDHGLDDQDPELAFTVKFSAENCAHSLCLPIVKNIVSGFAGDISFTTSQKGTTFFIRIPKL